MSIPETVMPNAKCIGGADMLAPSSGAPCCDTPPSRSDYGMHASCESRYGPLSAARDVQQYNGRLVVIGRLFRSIPHLYRIWLACWMASDVLLQQEWYPLS